MTLRDRTPQERLSPEASLEYTGEVLTMLRESRGWTQAEVAEKSGSTQPTISAYETGRAVPPLPTLARLLGVLGYSFVEFANRLQILAIVKRWKAAEAIKPGSEGEPVIDPSDRLFLLLAESISGGFVDRSEMVRQLIRKLRPKAAKGQV